MLLQYATSLAPQILVYSLGKLLLWSENALMDVTWMSESEPGEAGLDTDPASETARHRVK